eukprot:766658-Hanusia_phi.AAC.5
MYPYGRDSLPQTAYTVEELTKVYAWESDAEAMSSRQLLLGDLVPSDKDPDALIHVRDLEGDLPPWYNPAQFSVWNKM